MRIVKGTKDPFLRKILLRGDLSFPREEKAVRAIIENVRKHGDTALIRYSLKLDRVRLTAGKLRVPAREISSQAAKCPLPLRRAIDKAVRNIRAFHRKQLAQGYRVRPEKGVVTGQRVLPIASAGIYIPGGQAPLFSTILMTVIPAQTAGVRRIVAATPPSKKPLHPAMAYSFKVLKLKEIYRVGGAQAIAALAFGTKTVPRVDKIVGPGNLYVSMAKKILYGKIDIDMVAGPSEILVIADRSANPEFVARDLLSQAEHGTGNEAAVLLTNSRPLALSVQKCVRKLLASGRAGQKAEKAIKNYGIIGVLKTLSACVDLANRIAPEHLELLVSRPQTLLKGVRNAGTVFLGHYACESVGDYLAGPNHVLPTNGTARFYSPLGVYNFLKRMNVTGYSREALEKNGRHIIAMAGAEGLFFHADAVRIRL